LRFCVGPLEKEFLAQRTAYDKINREFGVLSIGDFSNAMKSCKLNSLDVELEKLDALKDNAKFINDWPGLLSAAVAPDHTAEQLVSNSLKLCAQKFSLVIEQNVSIITLGIFHFVV
jgi:hypothetical protein